MKVDLQGFRSQAKVGSSWASTFLNVNDLSVALGSKIAIFGENGAGKSTFLRALAFYDEYSVPGARIKGPDFDFSALSPKNDRARGILYLGSDLHSPFSLSVLSYFELLAERFALSKSTVLERLEKVHLTHLLSRPLVSLSSGERQMLLLTRAMLQRPKIVLIDETLSQLDLWNQDFWVNEIKNEGFFATWFVVSHDLLLLKNLCEEAFVFKKGECVAFGQPKELLTKESLIRFK